MICIYISDGYCFLKFGFRVKKWKKIVKSGVFRPEFNPRNGLKASWTGFFFIFDDFSKRSALKLKKRCNFKCKINSKAKIIVFWKNFHHSSLSLCSKKCQKKADFSLWGTFSGFFFVISQILSTFFFTRNPIFFENSVHHYIIYNLLFISCSKIQPLAYQLPSALIYLFNLQHTHSQIIWCGVNFSVVL